MLLCEGSYAALVDCESLLQSIENCSDPRRVVHDIQNYVNLCDMETFCDLFKDGGLSYSLNVKGVALHCIMMS